MDSSEHHSLDLLGVRAVSMYTLVLPEAAAGTATAVIPYHTTAVYPSQLKNILKSTAVPSSRIPITE